MPLSPAADTKHDRPRQQAVTNGNPTGSAVARDDDGDDTPPGNSIVVRIGIPDLQQTKCLRLDPELPVWTSKQKVLVTLTQSLSDVLNYGLFQPAFNGRAGKFLDEERLLKEYPLPPITPIPYLEVKPSSDTADRTVQYPSKKYSSKKRSPLGNGSKKGRNS